MTINKDEIISQLQEEISILRKVISIMPGNIYWKTVEGKYLGCNNNVANLFGLKNPEEFIGKEDADLMTPELAKKMAKNNLEVIRSKKEKSFEEHAFNLGKDNAVYLTKKVPYFDKNGALSGILGISFDITERKQMEQKLLIAKQKAEAANRAKSHFLAMISHELRTPLTSILGFTKLLEKNSLSPEKRKEYLQNISSSGSYLLSLINSLLDYNKLETNKFELMYAPLNLFETVSDVVNMLNGSASLKNLTLDFNYDENAPVNVMSSSRIIRQVLINLIGNAIKFTHEGGITVSVKLISEKEDSCLLQISVKDTGIGIPIHEQQSIFKRFYQLGNIYTRNASLSGTGLGLAIVKKLVKLLGGKIKVESTPNRGSNFYFTGNFSKVLLEESPLLEVATNLKILIINDNSWSFCHKYLTNISYDVISSQEILESILASDSKVFPYDIILIDPNVTAITVSELAEKLSQYTGNQSLVIPLELDTTSEWKILSDPNRNDIKSFQSKLKNAWENKLSEHKRMIEKTVFATQPYVLLLEDNKFIQIIHKTMLEELGCKVDMAETVNDAMPLLKNNYDILLVDIGLPDIAGFEFIKKIRQSKQKIAETPIVVVTGYSEEEEVEYCLRIGANDVLVKPVSENTLQKALNKYVRQSLPA